jgi:translation initiation factor IF-2
MPAKTNSSSSEESEPTPTPPAKAAALDLLGEKPKKKREPASGGASVPPKIGKKTAASAEEPDETAASKQKPAAADEKETEIETKKSEALNLFDKPTKKPRKTEDKATAAAAAKKSILTPISKSRAEAEAKKEQERAALESILNKATAAPAENTAATSDLMAMLNQAAPAAVETPAETAEVAENVVTQPAESAAAEVSNIIHLKPPIIVRDLAEKIGMKPFRLVAELMDMDIFVNQTQPIEPDVAARVCEAHGFIFERERREKGAGIHKEEKVIVEPPPPPVEEVKQEELKSRPPIITVMGHVDHGKTSLLDAIRKARVAAGEAGGITQHIGAYSVKHNDHTLTFLDTPGHAAFTAMRARGANLTDIVIIVVAADDGLMPQTIESINHAKAAGVTIVVAMNKMDLQTANPDRLYAQLADQGLNPEVWGGQTAVLPVSATKGTGIDDLLEHLLLEAEILELKSNPSASCRAVIVECRVEPGKGPTATLIPKSGTLKVGSSFICGAAYGKVKNMTDDVGRPIKSAGPATPVEVIGFSELPNVGDELVVMNDKEAKKLGEQRIEELRKEKLSAPRRNSLESIFKQMADGERKELKIVLKSDVQGSLEAITSQLKDIKSNKIDLTILHSGVGPITESDVLLGSASNAIMIGFSTKVDPKAVAAAKKEGVQIKLYSIIYELFDQVKEAMLGMLDPETREKVTGHAVVKQIFKIQKGKVAGCGVTDGRLVRTGLARVLRGKEKVPVYDGKFHTLRRYTEEVPEVRNGLECGVRLGDFDEYEEGDVIECYELEKLAKTL